MCRRRSFSPGAVDALTERGWWQSDALAKRIDVDVRCGIVAVMRTTLSIDDDALRIARLFAKGRRMSIGKAVSELLRKSAQLSPPTKKVNGLTIFDLPPDSPRITTEHVRKLLEDEI